MTIKVVPGVGQQGPRERGPKSSVLGGIGESPNGDPVLDLFQEYKS